MNLWSIMVDDLSFHWPLTMHLRICILKLFELTKTLWEGRFSSTFTILFAIIRWARQGRCSSSSSYISPFPGLTTNILCILCELIQVCLGTLNFMAVFVVSQVLLFSGSFWFCPSRHDMAAITNLSDAPRDSIAADLDFSGLSFFSVS